ncbi:MAG: PQQ-binding-like beta-propeller repeat protein [Opitutales bacterium]
MKRVVFCIAFAWCQSLVFSEDWPTWRGPRGDGTWRAPKLAETWPEDGLRRIWKTPVSPGYSGVSVANGKVYLMDRPDKQAHGEKERVLCLHADTGKELWNFSYSAPYGDLDYGTGPRAAVTIHNDKVYGFGAVGHAFCMDSNTGKQLWFRHLSKEEKAKRPFWGYACSPLVYGKWMLYQVGARPIGCVVALDAVSGETAWRSGEELAGYGPPVIIRRGERTEIVCWGPENIVGLPLKEDKELWKIPYKVKYGVAIATPIFREGIVFVSGYWHGSKAIRLGANPEDVTVLWEDEELCGLMSQPLYRGGYCYLLDRRHGLTCFELKTGKRRWRDNHQLTPKDRNPQASLVWVGDTDRALALNANGELILCELKPTGFKELERAQVTGKTWAHPAYSGNRVYLRNDREIVCYELPLQ